MVFKWIGSQVDCYHSGLENVNFKFYKSFYFRNENFKVGDFVLIKHKNKQEKVAMLLCVYHSYETWHRSAPYRGVVKWYTIANDLSISLQPAGINLKKEVIEDDYSMDIFVQLENITRKCKLIFASPEDPINLIPKNNLSKEIYYSCRYKIESGQLVSVFGKENVENYIVNNKLTLLPDVDNENKSISGDNIELENNVTPPQNFSKNACKRKSPLEKYITNNFDTEFNEMDSETTPKKIIKITSETQKFSTSGKFKKLSTKKQKFPVKRVLSDSFESSPKSYSIVNTNLEDMKLKIRLKLDNKFLENALVHTTVLADEILSLDSIKIDDIVQTNNEIVLSPQGKRKLDKSTSNEVEKSSDVLRRSTRNISRKSYVELISPKYFSSRKISEVNDNYVYVSSDDDTKEITAKSRKLDLNDTPVKKISVKSVDTPTLRRSTRKLDVKGKNVNNNDCNKPIDSPVKNLTECLKTLDLKTPNSLKTNLRSECLRKSVRRLTYDDLKDDKNNESDSKTHKKSLNKTATPKNVNKMTPTMKAKLVREGLITPTVHSREEVLVKHCTPLAETRSRLHVSYIPNALPCREKEFNDIKQFLEGKLFDGCGGCMYISGVPGTGKTATITEVICSLQLAAKENLVPTFKYVNINGMKLSEPRQSYVEIAKQLLGKSMSWEQAQNSLENRFLKSKNKSSPIILVVDELDILCTKKQDVVYNLLDWPAKGKSQLIVITIANTMDLPERLLMGRVTSRLGLTRLTFQPYTYKQLQEIVIKRLMGSDSFNADAIQLVARKVASVSGDARRALDICRKSAEIAELEDNNVHVSMIHVNKALTVMITQPKVQAIKKSSRLERLILQAVASEVERTGVEETHFMNVYNTLTSLAILDGFKMVSITIVKAAISKLGACRLLLTDQKCNDIHQRIILNVSIDDIYYALSRAEIS